ncbi:MAG: OmpA family protein, partial [Actinomycetota bacterium]
NRVNYDIEIEVAADGSGFFADRSFANDVRLEVAADGSGVFRDRGSNVDLTIEILPDGSGTYRDRGFQTIDVDLAADGSGSFQELAGPQVHEIWSEPDGTWTYHWTLDQDEVRLTVGPDGSGSFLRTGGTTDISIDVDEDGNVRYTNTLFDLDIGFVSEDGILDPELVVVSAVPSFVVAERFPALDGLAQLSPPCVSILRLDADVLFDFDAAVLRPETGPVVERLAEALTGTDQTIEVHGHTDSIGDEAYNQDLAARRAEAFAAALRAAGVTTDLETVSFGETMPVAPNERADGSDNPAGRQLNRRIEIVIPE